MTDFPQNSSVSDKDTKITLGLLNAIHEDDSLTQRSAAERLGIALGLTNAYLKRCVHMGLVKVTQAPANRYVYYLTPKGFAEKSRLTARYLTYSFDFFRSARKQCSDLLEQCAAQEWRWVALAGSGDLAEIAILCASDGKVTLVGIVDETATTQTLAGLGVVPYLEELGSVDAVILTDYRNPQPAYDRLAAVMAPQRILVPPLLNVSRTRANILEQQE